VNVTLRHLLPALALILSGCVLPNRLAEEDPFREPVIGFIKPGVTSRIDIEAGLGDRHLDSIDGQWWVFPADRRMTEWFWLICTPGGCGGAEFGGDIHRYNLIVGFDGNDLVRKTVVVTDRSPCVDDQSICLDDRELTIVENDDTVLFALEYDFANTPCASLRYDGEHESDSYLGELLASPGVDCNPALTTRNGLIYALDATEPYTGRLIVSDVDGVRKFERSYERGRSNGAETAWSVGGEKLYEANYRENLLHGLVTYWKPDGTIGMQLCFENGDVVLMSADDCGL